jgi:hypothetical protein
MCKSNFDPVDDQAVLGMPLAIFLHKSVCNMQCVAFLVQGVLSELLRSLVRYKSNAALAGDSLHAGADHDHMDGDLARVCHSPPLLRPCSGRLRSAGSAQNSPMRSNSNTYGRLGSSSFRGGDGDL